MSKFRLFPEVILRLNCTNGAYLFIEECCNSYTIWAYYKGIRTLNHCSKGELINKVKWIKDNMEGKHGLVLNCF